MKKFIFLYFILFTISFSSHLEINNIRKKNINEKTGNVNIQFDIKWEKSWKNEINCDGIWIFGKYKDKNGIWKHINLDEKSENDFNYKDQSTKGMFAGTTKDTNVETGIWIPYTKKGFFLFRTKDGYGTVDLEGVQKVWNYKNAGIEDSEINNVEVRIYGIEMAYVAEDAFYVGDPEGKEGPKNCFYMYPNKGAYKISSEEEIKVAEEEGALYCDKDTEFSRDDVPYVIPKEFPKGYKSFWVSKYELTNKQFIDFLMTLTRKQQQNHLNSDISKDSITNYYIMVGKTEEYERSSIIAATSGNGEKEPIEIYSYAPYRACNAISWADHTAYCAWSGLRPMTELEYEKACRGTKEPVPSEFAWGTTNIGRAQYFDGADGSGKEVKVPKKGLVNCCYGGGIAPFLADTVKESAHPGFIGPVSSGLFENSHHEGYSKRENDGSTYYGIMEMSGNLWEAVVTTGHPEGRKYKGSHGIGELCEDGYSTNLDWPSPKTAIGMGVRGGVFLSPEPYYVIMPLRAFAAHVKATKRTHGGSRPVF